MTIHEQIDNDRKNSGIDFALIGKARRYAKGTQPLTLTTTQARILRSVLGNKFADNVCRLILKAVTGRLRLERFEVGAETTLNWLKDELWTPNHLASLSGRIHYDTLRDGNSAVGLRWDNDRQRVRLSREKWWDGTSGVFVSYNEDGMPAYAVKEWKEGKDAFRTVYTDSLIQRFRKSADGWEPYALPKADGTYWEPVTAWVNPATGEPLGMPIVHFAAILEDDSPYGMSELDGGILGLQDEVNDLHRTITVCARATGYQTYWATGTTPPRGPDGNPIPLKVDPATVWMDPNKDAKFGTLPAGDLSQLETALNIKLQAVSRDARTPMHLITGGDWPSGEALIQADRPLVDKAMEYAEAMAPAWGSVAHKATVLANAWGGWALDTESPVIPVYANPERLNPLTMAQTVQAMDKYISAEYALEMFGVAPDKIATILEQRKKEQAEQAAFMEPLAGGFGGNGNE